MLILINLLFVLTVSFAIGAMFSIGLRGRSQWAGTIWFLLILFFGTWALGAWMRPMGPPAWDVYWVPYVVAAAVIALLLAAATPVPPKPSGQTPVGEVQPSDEKTAQTRQRATRAVETLSIFFWLLLAILCSGTVLAPCAFQVPLRTRVEFSSSCEGKDSIMKPLLAFAALLVPPLLSSAQRQL